MANAENQMVGVAAAPPVNYYVADVDATKLDGVNDGDWCYAIDTDTMYVWTGAAWSEIGGGGVAWTAKTANYLAVSGDGILADTSGGVWTLTLPASPTAGAEVQVLDSKGTFQTYNLTVDGNGEDIQGIDTDLICAVKNTALRLVYSGATVGWEVFDLIPSLASTVPNCDDSSIGTDLVAFNTFSRMIQNSIDAGITFKSSAAPAQIVSTYALVYTVAGAYSGGVLAPNGDIHFVPYSANVGQKITAAGVVATYSLAYTTGGAYWGGVLAPNGDIHFVPYLANVGQMITAAGVVTTYTLAYTTSTGAHSGGVLAPNGDIHFVPYSANVGQKITAAGVVTTYSLAYTTSSAYRGGVLAPNGDIYFVSYSTIKGQKINTMPTLPFNMSMCLSSWLNKF